MEIQRVGTRVQGRSVEVLRGGRGSTLLLLHGGWGGAQMHWSRIWDRLTPTHDVIGPDLPGLGAVHDEPLKSVREYAGWLVDLLDALSVRRAVCVGNSFGASVAWSFAGRFPDRCAGLVLVNGFPMPRTPKPLVLASRLPGAHALACKIVKRIAYSERVIPSAFADVANVPAELTRAMRDDWPVIVPRYVDILFQGDGAPTHAPLLLWGSQDRLPGGPLASRARR